MPHEEVTVGAPGTDYGNWMSATGNRVVAVIAVALAAGAVLAVLVAHSTSVAFILGVLAIAAFVLLAYMAHIRRAFSFTGGRVMDKLQQHLVEHLDWDGAGMLLDVGCGSGSLAVRCAKTFPQAQVVGMDYWGAMWNYSKELCERNAQLEGVGERCSFQQGDARKLDFPDESFDAVVSNNVYSQISGAGDQKALILETLRTLKSGGAFCIQDLFDRNKETGVSEDMAAYLLSQGIREAHFTCDLHKQPWVGGAMAFFTMTKDYCTLWGRK